MWNSLVDFFLSINPILAALIATINGNNPFLRREAEQKINFMPKIKGQIEQK